MACLATFDDTSDVSKPVKNSVPGPQGKGPDAQPHFTSTVAGVSEAMVGLAHVENIADTRAPLSVATQPALDTKAPVNVPTFNEAIAVVSKAMAGLGDVNHTADTNDPLRTTTQAALDARSPSSNPLLLAPSLGSQRPW